MILRCSIHEIWEIEKKFVIKNLSQKKQFLKKVPDWENKKGSQSCNQDFKEFFEIWNFFEKINYDYLFRIYW
jgi:hypothetical protein